MKSSSAGSLDPWINSLLAVFDLESGEVFRKLVENLDRLPERSRDDAVRVLERASRSLPPLAQSLEACPISSSVGEHLGDRARNEESLVDALCRNDWLPHDFSIPTGALLGRSLELARVNFLKSLRYCLEPCRRDEEAGPWVAPLIERLRDLEDNGIFRKLAEELLTFVVANLRNSEDLRKAAARKLLRMWNHRERQAVGDFPTVLMSAWKARSQATTIYGTLFGSEEILSLIRGECEQRFLNFFTRDSATPRQTQAFREFLFGLPHEELLALEKHMRTHALKVISRDQVHEVLGRETTYTPTTDSEPTAEEIFASYYRRRIRSEYRVLSGNPGPDKTAEGYIMEALLREEFHLDGGGDDAQDLQR